MDLSKELIDEFKQLYFEEFGVEINDDEALEIAQRLLGFCLIICRPLPNQEKTEGKLPTIGF